MERKIGEIFEYNGEWYQCVKGAGCQGCDLETNCKSTVICIADDIKDREEVIFKKLEKVGEPYMDGGKIIQKYKRVYQEPIYFPYKELNCYNDLHGRICIEIKQNMEEKKPMAEKLKEYFASASKEQLEKDLELLKRFNEAGVSVDEFIKTQEKLSLKPFSLEEAKSGKPVRTRDGRKARIICFDAKGDFPIAALVETNNIEEVEQYTNNGSFNLESNDLESGYDLMMLPEKKEGWAVIRRSDIYETEEQAVEAILNCRVGVMIRKITWEE